MVNREAKPYTQEAFASTLFSFEIKSGPCIPKWIPTPSVSHDA
jgi:hypothetical protein